MKSTCTPTSSKSRTMSPRGFAVIIVVFFSVIILISVTSAAFYSALGTRNGTANDRTAYQALLAAESGLDTFPTRYSQASTKPTITYPSAPQTGESTYDVDLGGLGSVTIGGVSVTLTAKAVTSAGNNKTLRLTSTATTTSGNNTTSKKVVLRDFTPPTTGGGFGNTPAAVTSFNSIEVKGNASISGYDTNVLFANVNATPNASVNTTSNTITVDYTANSAILDSMDTGDKVRLKIGGTDYDFTVNSLGSTGNGSKTTYQVTLSPTSSTTNLTTISSSIANAEIRRAPVYTTSSALTVSSGSTTSTLPLASATGLRVDQNYTKDGTTYSNAQTVSVVVGTTTYTGTITNISGSNVTVTWSPTPTSAFTIPSGTRIDAVIPALLSKYNVTTGGSSTTGSIIKYSKWFSARESMFETFFGVTKNKMQSSSSVTTVSPSNFNSDMDSNYTNKIVYVTGDLSITGQPGLCGNGYILIVDGDLTINQSDNCFKGIVYSTGDFRFQGNPAMKGSIVVEGDTTASNIEADGDAVTITGTQGGTFKMKFDPFTIASLASSIPSSATFATTSTWRQK